MYAYSFIVTNLGHGPRRLPILGAGVAGGTGRVPVETLLDAGVAVALATDDPLLFGTGLAGQYEICRDVLGLPDDRLTALAADSIRCSAAPAQIREELLRVVRGWLDG